MQAIRQIRPAQVPFECVISSLKVILTPETHNKYAFLRRGKSGFRVRVRMPAPRRSVKRGVSTQGVATPHILYLNRWTFTAGQHTYRFRSNQCYITVRFSIFFGRNLRQNGSQHAHW